MKKKNLLLGALAAFGLSGIVAMSNVYAAPNCNPTNESDLATALSSCSVIELDSGNTYNTATYTISSNVTINGNGATVHGTFTITAEATDVTFNNLTITSTDPGRGEAPKLISVDTPANVTISNATIYSGDNNTPSEYIYNGTGIVVNNSSGNGSTINITSSKIHAKYAVWLPSSNSNLNVTDSELSGYAALDLTSSSNPTSGNKVTINHSTLTGYAIGNGDNNNFGTIVIGNKTGVTIDITNNSTITNDFTYGTARSDLILISDANDKASGAQITVSDSTLSNTNDSYGAVYNANNTNDNSFETENTTITGKLISGEEDQFYVDFVVYGKHNVVLVKNNTAVAEADIPKPTKSGYTFVGWYEDQTYENLFGTTSSITADKTVYAKFIKNSTSSSRYYVTFVYDGKSTSVGVDAGAVLDPKDIPTVTKEGYAFSGWYLEDTYENLFYTTNPISKSMTVYAKFVKVDEQDIKNPGTSDNIGVYIVLAISAIAGVGGAYKFRKRFN